MLTLYLFMTWIGSMMACFFWKDTGSANIFLKFMYFVLSFIGAFILMARFNIHFHV